MEIMIWGCGKFGKQAYHYYNENFKIVGFVDNDSRKWGTYLFDKMVYSPDVLEDFKGKVIIAVKSNYDVILELLEKMYGISESILFKVEEQPLISREYSKINNIIDENTIMIYFMGGLGNQMFQYALAKNYMKQGKKVLANIEHYSRLGKRVFVLCDIFKNITLNFGGDEQKKEIIEKNVGNLDKYKNFRVYVEEMQNGKEKSADMSLLNTTGGILHGFYQSFRFAQKIEKDLRTDFTFGTNNDYKFVEVLKTLQALNCVSVHIRRGDYTTEKNQDIYGGICTLQYYKDAMKIVADRDGSCVFCFFSNDMKWVKEHFKIPEAIYIESNMFENYQDWYDMYLMSQCKHNIIANSTFSWWGAWLNQNKDKLVIAPAKWNNIYEYRDICPDNWITL
nr:alpha-1,2-fucosyltransferase [uncultured Acetatifactor sp.]